MVANSPGFLPKTAVVASRAVFYPFSIPSKLNESATKTGAELNQMVRGINASIGNAYGALEPRGPAKWLMPLFGKINAATDHSDKIAARNKAVFWDPFSEGVAGVGQAIAGPGAYWYLRKSGMEEPTSAAIRATLEQGLFDFGPPQVKNSGGDAAAAAAAAAAAQQAATGAGEVTEAAA